MPTALVIHGHFYQPPRENPWTGAVDSEPGAAPFHDWNERIHAECYAPNVVNYPLISFNFGPTLLSWLESHHMAMPSHRRTVTLFFLSATNAIV